MAFNLDSLLVGASKELNETLASVNSVKTSFLAQVDDVTAEASAMKSAVEGDVASLVGKLKTMIPDLS